MQRCQSHVLPAKESCIQESAKQERWLYLSSLTPDMMTGFGICSAGFQSCCGPHFLTIP